MLHQETKISLYLIRHAEGVHQDNSKLGGRSFDATLTPRGVEQATLLGQRFHKQDIIFDAIYSSPIIRSIQTATIALSQMPNHSQVISTTEALQEFSQGDWEGLLRAEIYTPEVLNRINSKGRYFTPPNGESQRMTERRFSNWVEDEILYNPIYLKKNSRIAFFSHGIAIKCYLHHCMGFNDRLIYKIDINNASITHLTFDQSGWGVKTINDTAHLYIK